jgi:hypothetical protein
VRYLAFTEYTRNDPSSLIQDYLENFFSKLLKKKKNEIERSEIPGKTTISFKEQELKG